MAKVTVQVKASPAGLTRDLMDAARRALADVGDQCLEEANQTIPHEEGIMQDTGFVEVTRTGPTRVEGQVAYNTPYAVRQHEDPTLTHDEGREDHWLEKTVDRNRQTYAEHVAREIRQRLT